MEIVGGVGDAVYRSLRDPLPPTWYVPLAQFNGPPFLITIVSLSVRSNSTPILLTKSVTAALQDVNPRLALTFLPLADQVNASLAQERLLAMLAGFFGGLGLLLAGIGLYGVTSYAVSRRRKEIGIRMALGAVPRHVVRLVLSRVLVLVGIGVVIGWTVSVWASRFVESLLYGVKPSDPETLVGAALVLAIAASVAACFPAWRASRIDPAEVLRES